MTTLPTFALRAAAGRRWCIAVVLVCVGSALAGLVRAQGPDVGSEAQRESGKQLYLKYCSQCHGEKGDGEGYAAPHLQPRPRNFTLASTRSGRPRTARSRPTRTW